MQGAFGMQRVTHDFNQMKACRYGKMLFNLNDTYVGNAIRQYGEWSQEEMELLRHFIQPGAMVLDIGANIGAHTIFFSQAVGMSGLVYAFEPQQMVFQLLAANMALNSITNVNCYPVAVGDLLGSLKVPCWDYSTLGNFGSTSLRGDIDGEPVSVVTVDSLTLQDCHLMKIDAEGMEPQVLAGAFKTLQAFQPVLYVEDDRPENSEQLIRLLTLLGYSLYHHKPRYYNPQNYFKNPENIFYDEFATNLLCLPPKRVLDPVLLETFQLKAL